MGLFKRQETKKKNCIYAALVFEKVSTLILQTCDNIKIVNFFGQTLNQKTCQELGIITFGDISQFLIYSKIIKSAINSTTH
jgi:hypothetical protein